MTDDLEPPPIPSYQGVRTLIFDEHSGRQVAWLDTPIWPAVGSVIELGQPNRDAVVVGVRLQLPQAETPSHGRAVILVLVDDPGSEGALVSTVGDRILDEQAVTNP